MPEALAEVFCKAWIRYGSKENVARKKEQVRKAFLEDSTEPTEYIGAFLKETVNWSDMVSMKSMKTGSFSP